ncbi:hypothetical protein JQ554_03360 [Bradyrhizobium diazoefficiens]|nr:hypothetical protein [Bradyrhizobium diazoefficiens]MBR0963109.1 hypothetical protein [Bradyrhizobium diazoefficiens]MBR0977269.1 hypothetical protein [Bradyrhizobium diazoefficiens]MBR1005914.1 hypothetical protein [Bradyrhizobium diazoefficiens]MBR1012387.1 hypothetical protein [Bradyrhizobium diazoefficiens]MBR1049729.1 hypothetical protein [Bradyrhizobium diazoefficiens]
MTRSVLHRVRKTTSNTVAHQIPRGYIYHIRLSTGMSEVGHKPPIMLEVAYIRVALVSRRSGVSGLGPEGREQHESDASRVLLEASKPVSLTLR